MYHNRIIFHCPPMAFIEAERGQTFFRAVSFSNRVDCTFRAGSFGLAVEIVFRLMVPPLNLQTCNPSTFPRGSIIGWPLKTKKEFDMPMIDVYAAADLFSAGTDRQLGEQLTLA